MIDWSAARRNMVESQVRTNGVTDRALIESMLGVPRERFAPAHARALAYCDEEIPLSTQDGAARCLVAPMIFARMVQLAAIREDEIVLDVGCATGYSSAVMARLAGSVVALEETAELAERAQETLSEIGIDNVAVVNGPLNEGYPSQAPYDAIVLGGAVEEVPDILLDQLGEGGRLVAVVQGAGVGRAFVYIRNGDHVGGRAVFDATIPVLPGFRREKGFVFQPG